jgi:alpha/beta superfamily hydrolase
MATVASVLRWLHLRHICFDLNTRRIDNNVVVLRCNESVTKDVGKPLRVWMQQHSSSSSSTTLEYLQLQRWQEKAQLQQQEFSVCMFEHFFVLCCLALCSISAGFAMLSKTIRIQHISEPYELAAAVDSKQTDSKEIAILCHGLLSSKDRSVPKILAEALATNTCRFDFAGNGESGGAWSLSAYDREVEDLRSVVQHLRAEHWHVTAVIGHSKGAAAVMQYAAKYDDVPLVISVAGRFDTSQTPRSRYTEQQWQQLADHGSFQWVVNGKEYPVTQQNLDAKAAIDMSGKSFFNALQNLITMH